MGALADVVVEALPLSEAVLFLALATVDVIQVKWMDRRLNSHEDRIQRVEGHAMTDGGEPDD